MFIYHIRGKAIRGSANSIPSIGYATDTAIK